jgi:hypothetical protein
VGAAGPFGDRLYPFGHAIGYTTFALSGAVLTLVEVGSVEVAADLGGRPPDNTYDGTVTVT